MASLVAPAVGVGACGGKDVSYFVHRCENLRRSASRRACSLPIALRALAVPPAVPRIGIVNDISLIERRAQHGGIGHLAAIPTADAGLIDACDRDHRAADRPAFCTSATGNPTGECRRDRRCMYRSSTPKRGGHDALFRLLRRRLIGRFRRCLFSCIRCGDDHLRAVTLVVSASVTLAHLRTS